MMLHGESGDEDAGSSCAASVGSIGSLDRCSACPEEEQDIVLPADFGGLPWMHDGPESWMPHFYGPHVYGGDGGAAADDGGDGGAATDDVGDESGDDGADPEVAQPRDPRLGSSIWAHDDVGLARDGRRMYCDCHDLRGGSPNACMAVDMLQQSRISAEVEGRQSMRARRGPRDDRDGREARHALYKAVVAWQWANPLGAENRVRLPSCVLHRVRRLFPNPCCGEGCCGEGLDCDYMDACERHGHYTGFRTAAESRAVREGRFVQENVI